MLKTVDVSTAQPHQAYHLGEGRVLKTDGTLRPYMLTAYHLGEGRVLKTIGVRRSSSTRAYHLGEGRVLKTCYEVS